MAPKLTKKSFLKSSEGTIASYSSYDFAEATGITDFHGCAVSTSAATTYVLTTTGVTSSIIDYGPSTEWPTNNDYRTFETTFNLPKNIRGTIIANIPILWRCSAGAVVSASYYVLVTAQKETGGVTSDISSEVQSKTHTTGNVSAAGTYYNNMFAVPLAVSLTHFKKGDKLKFKVQGNITITGGTFIYLLGHDPANWDTTNNLDMQFHVPFVIDR
jgi:hypothetical protein